MMPNEHTPSSNCAKSGAQSNSFSSVSIVQSLHSPVSPPLPTLATCMLATLIAGGFSVKASADVSVPTAPVPEPANLVASTRAVDLGAPVAIAPPETAPAVTFAETRISEPLTASEAAVVVEAVAVDDFVTQASAASKAIAEVAPDVAEDAGLAKVSPEPMLTTLTPVENSPNIALDLPPSTTPVAAQASKAPAIALDLPSKPASYQLAQVTSFNDIQGHWAQSFIETLAARDVVRGFPDGSFRPDVTMTRAQFAAIVQKAFQPTSSGAAIDFADVPTSYWAYDVIQDTARSGFFAAESDNLFQPEQGISRNQALVSLVRGLKLTDQSATPADLNSYFIDAAQIPDVSRSEVAIATNNRLVVNYPNVRQLNPTQTATRADVAAFIYQALVEQGSISALDANAIANQYIAGPPATTAETPPTTPTTPTAIAPSAETIADLQTRLRALQETEEDNFGRIYEGSPSLSIANPVGFGADNGTGFISATYQERTRFSNVDDGAVALGVGLGDARKAVGVELSYTIASFGSNRDFGTGGFNVKVHRQLSEDFSVAAGWNGFITIGDEFNDDFEDSIYAVATKIFRTRDDINSVFSRVALTAGVGNGQFRLEEDVFDDDNTINPFGSVAVRVARPLSAIVEWTGQDLAAGLSIVPFRNQSLVITPALRDIAGAGDGARFVLGVGYSWKF